MGTRICPRCGDLLFNDEPCMCALETDSDEETHEPEGEAPFAITGEVVFNDFEGGFWGLVSDEGEMFRPLEMPEALQQAGVKVSLLLRPVEVMSFQMWGEPVEIVSVEDRSPAASPDSPPPSSAKSTPRTPSSTASAMASSPDEKTVSEAAGLEDGDAKQAEPMMPPNENDESQETPSEKEGAEA